MAGTPPTAAEFEQWLTPGEALERFHPGGDVAERKRAIIRRLAAGRLRAAGYGGGGLVIILAARWRDWSVSDNALWTIGDACFSRGGRPGGDFGAPILFVDGEEFNPPPPEESVTFTDVRLDPARLGPEFAGGGGASGIEGGKIAAAEVERFVRLYLELWGAAATEGKALAAIRCCYPEAAIGRDTFRAKFRELRGPGRVGKPGKDRR